MGPRLNPTHSTTKYPTPYPMPTPKLTTRLRILATLLCTLTLTACQFDFVALPYQTKTSATSTSQLLIETTSLPGTYPRAAYSQRFQARGGTSPYRCLVQTAEILPGL